eukprot:s806_g15.t1
METHALGVTAKDCLWQHWNSGKLTNSDGAQFGAFKLEKSKSGQHKLTLQINDGSGPRTLAQLCVINFLRSAGTFEIGYRFGGKREMVTDAEFALTSDWAALGGSPAAATYFKMGFCVKVAPVAFEGPALVFLQCTKKDQDQYAKTCRKYLGDSTDALYKQVLDDCIFDLCSGGGDSSAELPAKIYHAE